MPRTSPWTERRERPLVICHRGLSAVAPENTLAAYRMVIDAGYEFAECDVHVSADGVPVVFHDHDLARLAGIPTPIAQFKVEQLKSLDVGAWKSAEFAGERIPTLAELLAAVKGKLRLAVELKVRSIEQRVIEVIQRSGIPPADMLILAWEADIITRLSKLAPELPTALLFKKVPQSDEGQRDAVEMAAAAGAWGVAPRRSAAKEALIAAAHERELAVLVWTVNDAGSAQRLAALGVDGLISDAPDVVQEAIRE